MAERQTITKKLRFEVFKRDNFTCQYCGRMAPDVILEIDHINPVKNNGDNNILNLITSCRDCNRGKGAKKITENDVLKRQQEQLKEINERKQQLELLLKWKNELSNFEDEQVNKIESILSITNNSFSEYGRKNCKKLIKRYGFEEVYESTKISVEQYYKENDEESITKCFNYIDRICATRAKQKDNPLLYKINYLVKIAHNRLSYINEIQLRKFLKENLEEQDFEDLKEIFCTSRNWTDLKETLNYYYNIED